MARMYVKNKDVLKCTLLPYCFDFLYNMFVIVCVAAAAHLVSVLKKKLYSFHQTTFLAIELLWYLNPLYHILVFDN